MARLEFRLSKRSQQDGTHEIMLRFHHGNLMNLRTGSRIFISPDFFEFDVDEGKCKKYGITIPKSKTIAWKDKDKYCILDRGHIIIRSRIITPDVAYHREQQRKLDDLSRFIIDAFKPMEGQR